MQENAKELVFPGKGIIIYYYSRCEIVFFFVGFEACVQINLIRKRKIPRSEY